MIKELTLVESTLFVRNARKPWIEDGKEVAVKHVVEPYDA